MIDTILYTTIELGLIAVLFKHFHGRHYRKVRSEIFEYVKGHKRLCTGNNRFVVTVTTLQDVFREYDTEVIEKVWIELVEEHLVQLDPQDNEWCIR